MTVTEVLDDFPNLTQEDIQACFAFAADRKPHVGSWGMKLLFDQNLSPKLANRLADLFPGSCPVQSVGLDSADDDPIWEYARLNG